MPLPRLEAPPCLQLTQTVWGLATENLRWPSFAELDRRLDSRYELQAEDVLLEMPPGFLYGFGPNSPVPPQDTQDIALTVAGVATCRDTREVLSLFLQLTQIAAATEKGWQQSIGGPEAPTITSADFAAQARNLPAAGRDDLLQLVFLMLKAEPHWGWTSLSGPTVEHWWSITIDRRIRHLRGVETIDEYWNRRVKPWQDRRIAPVSNSTIYTPTAEVAAPAPVSVNNYNFNAPVAATNFAAGDHATITTTNTDEIRKAVQAIIDALPSLNLDVVQEQQASELAASLIGETARKTPDPSKLTRAVAALRVIVATSTKTALATTFGALLDAALTKAGLPPGTHN